jgi:hypothetical protein
MSKLQEVLDQIKDPTVTEAKTQFQQMLNEGQASSDAFIQSSTAQLEEWLTAVSNKTMTQEEFDELVAAQTIVAKNFVARQSVATQERAEKLTIDTLEFAATKILPLLIVAAL